MCSKPNPPDETSPCPLCGEPMQLLPALNGTHDVPVCQQCSKERKTGLKSFDPAPEPSSSSKEEACDRFKNILLEEQRTKGDPPPDWMLDKLPKDARRLLSGQKPSTRPSLGPGLSDDLAKALRDQGYIIHKDDKGVHLGGSLVSRGGSHTPFSPYDVIRMAADMEGGIAPADELTRCRQCEALIPHSEKRCQWCDTPAD